MAIGSLTAPIRSFCSKAGKYCWENSFYLASYWGLALSTSLFAAKIFPSMPTQITVWSRAGKSFTGAIWLKGSIDELINDATDLSAFYSRKIFIGMLLTANKIVFQTIDLVLVSGGVIVSIASISGRPLWRDKFYQFMRPYTITSLCLSSLSLLTTLVITKALNTNRITTDRDLWAQSLLSAWDKKNLTQTSGNKKTEETEQIERNFICLSFDAIIASSFYLSQALTKLKPDTTLSVGLTWSVGVVSTLSLNYRKSGSILPSSKS